MVMLGGVIMNFLSLDVGTTCCKCQLFSETGEILFYRAEEYNLKKIDGETYVDVDAIHSTIFSLIRDAGKIDEISSIAVSSFGEAFVMLGENDQTLFYPMLYTDTRGEEQANNMKKLFDENYLYNTTGVLPHPMYSISKILWIKENYPDVFKKAQKVLLIGDYIGYLLTGERVIDYALAARTGVFDIKNKVFSQEILSKLDVPSSLFSTPKLTGTIVGNVTESVAQELGISTKCKLVLGSHDQVCATLGAGVISAGNAADGMGTVECITAVFDELPTNSNFGKMGYPTVPFAIDGLYCTYILNYSSGSLVNWFRKGITHGYSGDKKNFFEYAESEIPTKPTGLLTLPYFAGAATPYQDSNAKGAIIGLTLNTTDVDIHLSILEGTSYEMRLNLETVKEFGIEITNAVATGGGANSKPWLQIKSNITNLTLSTLRSSEGGLCGVAILQAVAMGATKDYAEAKKIFVRYTDTFTPNVSAQAQYNKVYKKYKNLYKTIKELY